MPKESGANRFHEATREGWRWSHPQSCSCRRVCETTRAHRRPIVHSKAQDHSNLSRRVNGYPRESKIGLTMAAAKLSGRAIEAALDAFFTQFCCQIMPTTFVFPLVPESARRKLPQTKKIMTTDPRRDRPSQTVTDRHRSSQIVTTSPSSIHSDWDAPSQTVTDRHRPSQIVTE